ncbi:MAG: hypothetical protein QNJ53_17740 [Pleurocapsa sp. MO_192.B19]|nr:hypothetical protein [Pleurocapsa sp. MO_192.B19]
MRKTLITLLIGIGVGISPITPVTAQTTIIDEQTASSKPTDISIAAGKATAISFENDEVITFVLLSDQSKNIYTLNAPIESGQAKSIFLRQIQNLTIPGTTTTENPNLFVVTTNAKGKQIEYEFILNNSDEDIDSYQIAIKPAQAKPKPKIAQTPLNEIQTDLGAAMPEDIQLGLETKLKKGLLKPNDPLVFSVSEYIGLTMNGTNTNKAIEQVEVPISILQKLGRIGLEEDARRRLLPLDPRPLEREITETSRVPQKSKLLK